jgi:hypothetical protein
MVVALAWALVARHIATGVWWAIDRLDVAMLGGIILFFLGSRDTLRKYYGRAGDLLRYRRVKK